MGSEKRRHDRYSIRLPVELVNGTTSTPGETVDVSFGGLFIRTSVGPPARQLVKVKLKLPPRNIEVVLLAMAVFVEKQAPENLQPGAGLQLFGLDPQTQEIWEAFIRHVQTLPHAARVPQEKAEQQPVEDHNARELWSAMMPEFRITTRSIQDLQKILRFEFSRGRIYVRTEVTFPPKTRVEIHLVHPLSNTTFSIIGEVNSVVNTSHFTGLRIALPKLNPNAEQQLSRFVRKGTSAQTIDLDSTALANPSSVGTSET
ncbi:MAG: PilZ domain-containing protein [Myxococcales bacterium]|nr:PilZ domain-containing protein [Myxococcales bacterium]